MNQNSVFRAFFLYFALRIRFGLLWEVKWVCHRVHGFFYGIWLTFQCVCLCRLVVVPFIFRDVALDLACFFTVWCMVFPSCFSLLSMDLALFPMLVLLLPLCVLLLVFVVSFIVLFTFLLLPLRFFYFFYVVLARFPWVC